MAKASRPPSTPDKQSVLSRPQAFEDMGATAHPTGHKRSCFTDGLDERATKDHPGRKAWSTPKTALRAASAIAKASDAGSGADVRAAARV